MESTFDINKLTLEHFTNKAIYRKYLAKSNPDKCKEKFIEVLREKNEKLKLVFMDMLEKYPNSEHEFLHSSFEKFIEDLLEYLRKIEYSQKNIEQKSSEEFSDEEFSDEDFSDKKYEN